MYFQGTNEKVASISASSWDDDSKLKYANGYWGESTTSPKVQRTFSVCNWWRTHHLLRPNFQVRK